MSFRPRAWPGRRIELPPVHTRTINGPLNLETVEATPACNVGTNGTGRDPVVSLAGITLAANI
jgi:hypothetical protein